MRHKSLVATAAFALLAGTVLASAQGVEKKSGGAMEHGMQQQGAPGGAMQNRGEEGKGQRQENRAQRSEEKGKQPSTTGQGQPMEPKASEPKTQRSQEKGKQPATSGQGQQSAPPVQSAPKAGRDEEKGAPKARQGQQRNESQTQGQRTGAGGAVTLTTEQKTKIRTTVLQGGNAPRVNKVNFSISVGTVVPRSVKVVAVPAVIVDIHPQWRGFFYFVYEDEIIIVDRNHHIVAILEV